MAKIAVDVVLIVPDDVVKAAREYNKELQSQKEQRVIFDEDCTPHISLAMGVLDEKDIDTAKVLLQDIADNNDQLVLDIEGLFETKFTNAISLDVTKTDELQLLHEIVTERFKELMSREAEKSMFLAHSKVSDSSPNTVRDYVTKGSYANYQPHVTLGHGKIEFKGPLHFPVTHIAICRLGPSVTCREILYMTELR